MSGVAADDESGRGLGRRAARGALVTVGGQTGRIVLQVLSVVILARLLTPGDYGVIAMVLAVVGIGEIFRDFGLSSAAIQSRTLSHGQRDNLFWINTAIGLLLTGLVHVAAPLLAGFYQQPILDPLARALSVTFLLNGLATQYRASLTRDLLFGRLTLADVIAPAAGLVVAVVGAVLGWGVWALVAQQIGQALVYVVLLAIWAGWLPRLPDRRAEMRPFLTFGGNLVATQLIGYVANNIDSVIIGLRFGPAQLGVYNRGFQLLIRPLSQLRAPTTTVALPVLARLHDDVGRYADFIARGQLALGYSLIIGLGIVFGAADPIASVVLGPAWVEVGPILRLLAAAGIFDTLAYVGYWVYLSRGLTHELLRYSVVAAAIKITCILVGSLWGVLGVAAGFALAPAIAWPLSLWWLSRKAPIPVRRLMTGALRILAVTVVGAAAGSVAVLLAAPLGGPLSLAAGIGGSLLAYALVTVVPMVRRDVTTVIEIGKAMRKPPPGDSP
ncbi:MAG: hypothetical protein RI885_1330 [Actinomycetota bacterium]|jgi:PST family polysaccharide transporter